MKLPSIFFGENDISQFDQATKNEWLITNGLGGFASSTVLGLNSRKYHASLVAALRPPGERTVILSKLDEDVDTDGKIYQLGTNAFSNDLYPRGYRFLKEFSLAPFPTYTYKAEDIELRKTVFLPSEKNSTVALYQVNNRSKTVSTIRIYPLVTFRHFHYVNNRSERPLWFNQNNAERDVELIYYSDPKATVILRAFGGKFNSKPAWVDGLVYQEEINRGEAGVDESYQPGYFEFQVPENSAVKFAIATAANDNHEETVKTLNELGTGVTDIENLLGKEINRREGVLASFYDLHKQILENDGLSWLLQAANDFIVKGKDNGQFIIAGYQWFGSWGRDSFVSLPGLMLVNGRLEDARNVILDYTNYCKLGLVPNLIDDKTGIPLYNTVDGTLWYINSILQYLKYSGGFEFIEKFLWSTLVEVIENHKRGTLNNIHEDNDGLLAHGPQLTWMDAVVGDTPVTPRSGKAVEVQGLWYNALRTMQLLAKKFKEEKTSEEYLRMAERAKESFKAKFWNEEQKCLFDVIDSTGKPDASVRPNQIIVGALDFSIIDQERANSVVDFVQAELLTPVGLRTLSPKDSRYMGKYEGDRTSRDKAYHNGTIWPWLTGPLTTAYLKAKGYNQPNLEYANNSFIKPLLTTELLRGGLGTINEINDGDAPYTPRGCIAQAWSVAEPLRAYIEDILQIRPKFEKEVMRDAAKTWITA